MRLQVLSDLHLEFHGESDIPFADADLVILAGDIHEGLKGVEWAIKQSKLLGKPFLYVFGNHEYYNHEFPGVLNQAMAMVIGTDVHILERRRFVFKGVRFIGCTLWTDFLMFGRDYLDQCIEVSKNNMPDYQLISRVGGETLCPDDTIWLHARSKKWLVDELEKPWQGKTVIITHHAPLLESNNPVHANDLLTSAFVSDMDGLMKRNDIHLWIHGHTHYNVDYNINWTRVYSNQRGYPNEPVPGVPFELTKIIKI